MDTTSPSRTLAYLDLDKVAATVRNPKEHDLPEIVGSICRFGLTSAMVRDERTGELVIGNGRRHALYIIRKHLAGEKTPEVTADQWRQFDGYLDGRPPGGVHVDDGRWLVPVVTGWASDNDETAAAMVIADNRLTEKGGWDDRLKAELLDEIADYDPDLLTVTGFTADDLDDLLAQFSEEKITMDVGETGARWAETDEEYAQRSEITASYADKRNTPTGAMIEMILVFSVVDHGEAVGLIQRIRERDGDLTAAQITLAALRAFAPPADEADGHDERDEYDGIPEMIPAPPDDEDEDEGDGPAAA